MSVLCSVYDDIGESTFSDMSIHIPQNFSNSPPLRPQMIFCCELKLLLHHRLRSTSQRLYRAIYLMLRPFIFLPKFHATSSMWFTNVSLSTGKVKILLVPTSATFIIYQKSYSTIFFFLILPFLCNPSGCCHLS